MNFFWFLRMSRLVRRPHSGKQLIVIAIFVAIALGLYGIEQIWGWPDWLTPSGGRGRLLR
jgi:hypothetical protein